MILLRFVSRALAATVWVICPAVGFLASPETGMCIATSAYAVALYVYAARSERSGSRANAAGCVETVIVPGLVAGSWAAVSLEAVAGMCALCGTASPAVLAVMSLGAVVPVWRRWVRPRMRGPLICVVGDLSSPRPHRWRWLSRAVGKSWGTRGGSTRAQIGDLGATDPDSEPGQHPTNFSGAEAVAAALADMTIDQLCRAWRRSWLPTLNKLDPEQWERLAELRRSYLNELERRDPQGVMNWLASGARAGGDPGKFLKIPVQTDPSERGDGPAPHRQLTD